MRDKNGSYCSSASICANACTVAVFNDQSLVQKAAPVIRRYTTLKIVAHKNLNRSNEIDKATNNSESVRERAHKSDTSETISKGNETDIFYL